MCLGKVEYAAGVIIHTLKGLFVRLEGLNNLGLTFNVTSRAVF